MTAPRSTRARTELAAIEQELGECLRVLYCALEPRREDGNDVDVAMDTVMAFCSVAIRVMRKTNPAKIRSEAMTEEIKARIEGAAESVRKGCAA